MNYQELRNNHNVLMEQLACINGFIEDYYSSGTRVELRVLARKLRLKVADVPKLIQQWTEIRRSNGEKHLHKLCIFYTERHTKPNWFTYVSLSAQEYSDLVQASRRMNLPTLNHCAGLTHLLDSIPDGWTELCAQVSKARETIVGKLFDNGFVPDGSKFPHEVRAHDLRIPRVSSFQNIVQFNQTKVMFGWGYLAFDKLDALQARPNTADDFFVMKPREGEDDPIARRAAQNRIRHFISDMIEDDYLFVDVISSAQLTGGGTDKPRSYTAAPILVFTNKNELGVVVKATLLEYTGLGSFVLDR